MDSRAPHSRRKAPGSTHIGWLGFSRTARPWSSGMPMVTFKWLTLPAEPRVSDCCRPTGGHHLRGVVTDRFPLLPWQRVSGGSDPLWDAASGRLLENCPGTLPGFELIFSRDGLRLYSASGDQTIRIWDVSSSGSGHPPRQQSCSLWTGLSPDGTTLTSACNDGVVATWSTLPAPEKNSPD